jgi:catabolite regulation protein CreA
LRRLGLILGSAVLLVVVLFGVWIISRPERGTTGSVSTRTRLSGPDDKIVVDGFDDPKVVVARLAPQNRARHPIVFEEALRTRQYA